MAIIKERGGLYEEQFSWRKDLICCDYNMITSY